MERSKTETGGNTALSSVYSSESRYSNGTAIGGDIPGSLCINTWCCFEYRPRSNDVVELLASKRWSSLSDTAVEGVILRAVLKPAQDPKLKLEEKLVCSAAIVRQGEDRFVLVLVLMCGATNPTSNTLTLIGNVSNGSSQCIYSIQLYSDPGGESLEPELLVLDELIMLIA